MRFILSRRIIITLCILVLTPIAFSNCTVDGEGPIERLAAFCAGAANVGGDPNIKYIAGSEGLMLRTTDGGTSYSQVSLPFSYAIKDMGFSPDGVYGYAVGEDSSYARSADGGDTWTSSMLGLGTGSSLNGLTWAPLDPMIGWIVGDGGVIYNTTDRGVTWNLQTSGTTQNLYGICVGQDDLNLFAVGDNGTILKTINGGTDWEAKTSGTGLTLRACYRPDNLFGYSVGFSGTILKTEDTGETWNPADTGGATIDFYDVIGRPFSNFGIAAGTGGIYRSSDFGNTWGSVYDEVDAEILLFLKRLFLGPDLEVVAVGRTTLGAGFDFNTVPDLYPSGTQASTDGLTLGSDDDGLNWIKLSLQVQF